MKIFFESSREHAMKITSKRTKMKLLTNKHQESYDNAIIRYICKENFEDKYIKYKKYCKVRDRCHNTG